MAKSRSIGGIFAELVLRDEKFKSKLSAAAGVVKVHTAQMRKSLNSLASSGFTKIGAALGAAGSTAGIYKAVEGIDRLAKQADRMGMTTQSLAAFRHAAGLAGVEVELMEKSLFKMSKNVIEAATGNDNLANTFTKLGLDAQKLTQMAPDEQFKAISEALNKVGNASERAALVKEIFGSTDMISMVQGGADALNQAAKEAELLGLSLDRVDAAKVELANDAMGRLTAAGEGFFSQLTVKLAPIISEIGERVMKTVERFGGMGAVAEKVFRGIVWFAAKAADVFRGWELIIAGLNIYWKGMKVTATFVIGGIMNYIQTVLNTGVAAINLFIKAYNKLPIKQKAAELDKFTFAGIDATVDATKEAYGELQEAKKDFMAVVDKGTFSDTLPKFVDDVTTKWTEQAKEVAETAKETRKFEDITVTAAEKAEKATKDTTKAVKELKKEFMSFQDVADKGGRSANAQLARRALKAREKADAAEARGNFSQADYYRNMASQLESKVKRRGFDENGNPVAEPADPNKKLTAEERDSARAKAIQAAEAERRTRGLGGYAGDAAKAAAEARKGDKPAEPALAMPAEATKAKNEKPGAKKEETMLDKLDNLIALLIGLPKQLGVATS